MFIITTIFMIYCALKAIFYGIYEFKNNNNKIGGIAVISISILGFILSLFLISL